MVISGCSHKLETNACNITKGKKLEVMHITLEPGVYEIVNGKIPSELIGYLPIDMELPDRGAIAVSVTLPNGGWEFDATRTNEVDGAKSVISIVLSHKGGMSASVLNQLVQIFEFSEACDFENITLSQDIPKTQSKLL